MARTACARAGSCPSTTTRATSRRKTSRSSTWATASQPRRKRSRSWADACARIWRNKMRDAAKFRAHFEGLPNNILWTACSRSVSGIDYSNCRKGDLADAWVRDDYGIGKVEISDIDDHVVAMYSAGQIGVKQSAVVFNWLSREKLLPKLLKVKR